MASISLPASLATSPFDATPAQASPRTHRRQQSRKSVTAPPLPAFNFNPGADVSSENQEIDSEDKISNTAVMGNLGTRRGFRPSPLPDFRFNPGADLPTDADSSPTHPVLQEMAMNQQRVSRSARPAPLPVFTFAPNTGSAQPSPSPTRLNFPEFAQSGRSTGGHRRRGSEFVGGGNDSMPLPGTSPEKLEHRPVGPPVTQPPRGHTHRRSQAISISDIDTSELIKANAIAKARAGSTPTTPSEVTQQFNFARISPPSRQSISYTARSPPSSPQRRGSAPGSRPRVGFADRVDVIPRPLSLISSETEGSCSTVRGGHSFSGSINSIASPPRQPASATTSPRIEFESLPQRPQTADPATLLSRHLLQPDDASLMINLPKRPLSSGSPGLTSSGSPPNKKKHYWFSSSNNSTPTPSPHSEKTDPLASLPPFAPTATTQTTRPKTSPERTISVKKPRKYHTWTSSIFSRRAAKRSTKVKHKRAPTPPMLARRASDGLNEIFDADNTIVLREPSPEAHRKGAPLRPRVIATPSFNFEDRSHQVTSPVIDLDAALGPFGSDEKFGHEVPARTAASRIAKLHSSERRGLADAFGVVHRRAESAPVMPAINRSTFGVQRTGSDASLVEDVFDEEEEDNFLAGKSTDGRRKSITTLVQASVRPDNELQAEAEPVVCTVPNVRHSESIEGLGLAISDNCPDGIVIVDAEDDVAHTDNRSSNSTIEAPTFQSSETGKTAMPSPLVFAYPAPPSHYASSTEGRTTSASMISSPDPDYNSFDNQFTRNARFLGEPNPDFVLRGSIDDLPSLSDSISTGAVPRISSSGNTRSSAEQRTQSMFVPAEVKPSQAWKRASLASLNRLIPGSSNGSKLKFESIPTPPVDEQNKKKTNRLSRLMQFWRSKEKAGL